jgi:hypothetical protein
MDTSTSSGKQTIDLEVGMQYVCSKKPANKGKEFPVSDPTNHSPAASLMGGNTLSTFNSQLFLSFN